MVRLRLDRDARCMTQEALPSVLRGRNFTVAEAISLGMTRKQLRSAHLHRPARGVRSEAPALTLREQCLAQVAALPEDVAFSHLTAARLHGLPISTAMEADSGIHAIRPGRDWAYRARGVVGHRGLDAREVSNVGGLSLTSLADTWVDLGELIGPGKPVGLDDLVILGDAVSTRLGSVQPLRDALERRVRPRGKLTLVESLDWIRVGSESAGETITRLVVVRAGLPEPELNEPIITAEGQWLGRPDMKWRKARVLLEYQGREFHDSAEQRAHDAVRYQGFRDDDWRVQEAWNDDVNSDEARWNLVLTMAELLDVSRDSLDLGNCGPRFFSRRMLELAEMRARRTRARLLSEGSWFGS